MEESTGPISRTAEGEGKMLNGEQTSSATQDAHLADGGDQALPKPNQTPFFHACNQARYERQSLIREIQDATGRRLICYVADVNAPLARDDVLPFMDLFHNIPVGSNVDLLLQTGGGDIDVALKLVGIIRQRVGETGEFRVIVPDHAKSAGTLIAIGSDTIVMSDSSELGPIDPQIVTKDASGQFVQRPAHTIVDAYEDLVNKINDPKSYEDGKVTAAEQLLLKTYDPAFLNLCRLALERSRQLAEDLLKRGMLRNQAEWSTVAYELTDNKRWLEHSAVIDSASASTLGLKVKYMAPDCNEWQAYWRLYCQQRLALGQGAMKLVESDYASLQFS
jgi:hypothetical protein